MCFRNACKIRTNNHLESFHKDFKYNYLSGKVNKRLDFCIYKLMEFVKDKGCKRIIKLERGKITSKKKSIELKHIKSVNLDASLIQKESNNSSIVKGSTSDHNVEIAESECAVKCHLRCSKCSIYIHEIKCSCLENVLNGLICKHAHLVCRTQNVSKKSNDNSASVSEEIAIVHKILLNPRITETSMTDLSQSTFKMLDEIKSQFSNLAAIKHKEKMLEANKRLKNISNFLQIEDSEMVLPPPNSGNNKNVTLQRSFFSTRKERKNSSHFSKPSFKESNNIRKALIDDDVTIPESDHQAYCLQSQSSRPHHHQRSRSRSKSRRRYNPQGKYCFYHFRFGKKCLPGRKFRLFVKDRETGCQFLVDSRADVSIIPWTETKSECQASQYKLYAANGIEIPTYGLKILTLDLGLRRPFQWPFIIAKVKRGIIGTDFLQKFQLLIDLHNRKLIDGVTNLSIKGEVATIQENNDLSTVNRASKYFNLLKSYPDLTKPNLVNRVFKHGVKHHILTTGQPVYSMARQLAPDKLKLVTQEFQFMLDNDIIRPSKYQSVSPLHLVNKKNGTLRPCGDYRRLNAQTKPDRYPIPIIEDFNHILKDKKYFPR
ncbi:transposon Ty3-G Gag-Pol polyprotein [Trichonephila clavipes]|nr:transposon Ty3-G Gag-Pol polyprotein [Trichonephila clavipes]